MRTAPLTCCTGSGPHSLQLLKICVTLKDFMLGSVKDKAGRIPLCVDSVELLCGISKCSTEISLNSYYVQHFKTCLYKVLTVGYFCQHNVRTWKLYIDWLQWLVQTGPARAPFAVELKAFWSKAFITKKSRQNYSK